MTPCARLQRLSSLRGLLARAVQDGAPSQHQGLVTAAAATAAVAAAGTPLLGAPPSPRLAQLPDRAWGPPLPTHHIARAYAKPAKGKGGGGGGKKGGGEPEAAVEADQQQPEFDPAEFESAMASAVEHLGRELSGVRTGRANPGLLENIPVEAYGEKLPLKACGAVTVRNAQLLAVSVFDSGLVAAVSKAIQNSPLSLAPAVEGSEVLVKLPRMTKDTIEQMVKLVHMEVEGAHQSIRRARQKGMDAIKKSFKGGAEDERKRAEKEVQRLHDRFLAEAERLKKAKDAELREHRD
ncbi:hypothetical protein Rsub_05807 [Raphidocelis subcapitata]|uniref:Ribosome-recycling factor, chloroplastic n=1 Tax=Raphidocelis subcapitata TaxID=307507 RepID=A0A2V0NZA6_9CHLO|nr:hypothetical protein Rsub_05807 [Raphidocelis subcapitata]|eukprot:GBF92971.1 hypothetical protein Rsub_05807 [Raphidocelis subcapitata]